MNLYTDYLKEIEERGQIGLKAKPIDSADLIKEVITHIENSSSEYHKDCLSLFIYNTLPGTTPAAVEKAHFLKKIILGEVLVESISVKFAFELLSHMKGGPSIKVLLDLALGSDETVAQDAAEVLKTQVFLYDTDTSRLREAYKQGNGIATDILQSYSRADFFRKLPDIEEEIQVVTYVAAEGDISTDLLSPGNQAHSRSDRELHGKCMISESAQSEIKNLQDKHPGKQVMIVADKGTMGVGSSRMSGVNNVALWTGKKASPYIPFVNIAPIVGGTHGISPIFLTTVNVTGGIGLDLKNWVKKIDNQGQAVLDENGDPVLEQKYSVKTGTILIINTKNKKLYDHDKKELIDISSALSPDKIESIKAGGSYAVVFGKRLQGFASEVLGIEFKSAYASPKEVSHSGQGLTAVEKIFNRNAMNVEAGKQLHAGSDVRVKVNIVGSQDTTGLMTSQELESMAATSIAKSVDGAYQSGCHTASVWDKKARENIPKLMSFMNKFGLITARDPQQKYFPMTDVIHKVLNDLAVDDWDIIIGGDSHTRMSKGVAFGADSGTVALALATGEASMPIPDSVKVTFKGELKDYIDFRDVVHATQLQMLKNLVIIFFKEELLKFTLVAY